MKELHLICNAHLDPVWMWNWDDGASAALATFYSACELADEYDYIFCHNEALLYEFAEKFDPTLFERIKELVKSGKWHVMGGWYLQPDCNIPSGESFIRQIMVGREYFSEKFGVEPTTAINFDSFGHTRGLVQILKKTGYDSYMFCRPMPEMLELDDMVFNWVGYDGSKIKACRIEDQSIYCSGLGTARADIERKAEKWKGKNVGVALWGVGNHGGGPSRKDLSDIEMLKKESTYAVFHSTPERFFAEIQPKIDFDKPLHPCLVGTYSSMSRVKKAHIDLEHKLFLTEKICAIAALNCDFKPEQSVFDDAMRDLTRIEFHDVLSGTCASDGEASSLAIANHGLKILDDEFMRAYFTLIADYSRAEEGVYPVFVFNPAPYEWERVVEVEFLLNTVMASDEEHYDIVAEVDGEKIPVQVIKELSNINYDRRKRIAMRLKLKPAGITRVDCKVVRVPNSLRVWEDRYYRYSDAYKTVEIDKRTGALTKFYCDGVDYISGPSFIPVIFDDNADPWGWEKVSLGSNPQDVPLADGRAGIFKSIPSVSMVEDGQVLTEIECLFDNGSSAVRVGYKIYKNFPFVDVDARILYGESCKTLKLKISTVSDGEYIGQTAYGRDVFAPDGAENAAQRFIAFEKGNKYFAVFNDGVSASSKLGKDMYYTLLNAAAYCAHPIGDRPLVPKNRFVPYIEQGEHRFAFRVGVLKEEELEREAVDFVQSPYALSVFPHGKEREKKSVTLDNPAVVLHAMRVNKKNKTVIRLFNGSGAGQKCVLGFGGMEKGLVFGAYEIKTVISNGKKLTESKRIVI